MKSESTALRALAVLTVCLAASLPYVPAAGGYFVNDDFGLVQLLSQKPAFYFPRWFVTSWADEIWGGVQDELRPFPAVTYQFAAIWGPASTTAHHVINIVFHAVNALLVLAIARTVTRVSLIGATFAAVAFSILPLHVESVAWITGRSDTIPAMFFLGSFLAYARWRRGGDSTRLYVCSVALFFCALFSKQNTIVLMGTLFLYDLVAERRPMRVTWSWLAPYAPFMVLTAGYLLLRYVLFGQAAREETVTDEMLGLAQIFVGKHLQRMFVGTEVARYPGGYIAALAVTGGAWSLIRSRGVGLAPGMVLYFGPCWWFLGLLPVVVAGYESTRHVYLASVGWAIVLGLVFHALWIRQATAFRAATSAAAACLLIFYLVGLRSEVAEWVSRAQISAKVAADLQREALAAPEGSLLIVGAPPPSWEWALPFAAQPPFAPTDLTERVSIVSPVLLDCCRNEWMARTQHLTRTWAENRAAPVLALTWDDRTGLLSRRTDSDDPQLRSEAIALLQFGTSEALNHAMLMVLRQSS